jgi:hypothetical protein
MLCNDIVEIPKCLNPNCNNKVKLENIGAGFRKFCCNACIGQYQKTDKDFANKISKTHLDKKIVISKYPDLNISTNKNYFLIKDYCKHGDIEIYNSTFKKMYNNHICLCLKCKKEILNKYIPTKQDIILFQTDFENFYKKYRFLIKED